jgi:hypothetical protein
MGKNMIIILDIFYTLFVFLTGVASGITIISIVMIYKLKNIGDFHESSLYKSKELHDTSKIED